MSKMKLFNIRDIEGFFQIVEGCHGAVRLVGDGMDLDLRSRLSQYFSLAKCFGGDHLDELELCLEDSSDVSRFLQFAIEGR